MTFAVWISVVPTLWKGKGGVWVRDLKAAKLYQQLQFLYRLYNRSSQMGSWTDLPSNRSLRVASSRSKSKAAVKQRVRTLLAFSVKEVALYIHTRMIKVQVSISSELLLLFCQLSVEALKSLDTMDIRHNIDRGFSHTRAKRLTNTLTFVPAFSRNLSATKLHTSCYISKPHHLIYKNMCYYFSEKRIPCH
jgi:hypothetical protein